MLFASIAENPLPRIRLTSAVRALTPSPMTGHHTGMPVLSEPKQVSGLTIRTFVEKEPKMFALITKGDKAILAFTRCALTNFAHSPVELHGVPIACSEQLFKMHCVSAHYDLPDCTNCDEVMQAIVNAKEPRFAKTATNVLVKFNPTLWNTLSQQAMLASIMLILTNPATFERFKSIAAFAGEKELEVVEANDDVNWGINMFAAPFMEQLTDKFGADPDADLFETARGLYKGDNKLGKILTSVLTAIRPMEHADYLEATKGISFAELAQ